MCLTEKQKSILKEWIRHPKSLLIFIFTRGLSRFIRNDKTYLKLLYWLEMGQKLNLENPQAFQEKLQWLKLHNRKPEYTQMVDKCEAKKYVASIIGEEYIIPTLGVWNTFDEIDFSQLPNKFVLKCTHDSGRVIICKDKTHFDINYARKRINKALRTNYFLRGREWPYKNVKRRIIAEQFMEETSHPKLPLIDYKFYCFNGEPKYCQVIQDRNTKETIDFFDMDWKHQEFVGLNPAADPAAVCPEKPKDFDVMKTIAHDLSKDIPFARIDLYEIQDKTFFGEITLYPASGFGAFHPKHYEEILGKMISINGLGGGKFEININKETRQVEYKKIEEELKDFKFFCFDGKVECFKIDFDRFSSHRANYYDKSGNLLKFGEADFPPDYDRAINIPSNIKEMVSVAETLSVGIVFIRVDLYNVRGQIYFGEMTFFPASGMGRFTPEEWNLKLGEMIKLPTLVE